MFRITIILILFSSHITLAQTMVDLSRVSSALTEDWNQDGNQDSFILVENPLSVDLYIIEHFGDKPDIILRATEFTWRHEDAESQPSLLLTDSENPELQIHTSIPTQDPVGWNQTISLTSYENQWVVSGFHYGSWSHVSAEDDYFCLIRFLDGEYEKPGEFVTLNPLVIPVASWEKYEMASFCSPWDQW